MHVRGAIDLNVRSQLVQIRGNMDNIRYCNEIIDTHVLPLVRGMRGQVTFQHDNASPHRAQATIADMQANNILACEFTRFKSTGKLIGSPGQSLARPAP